MGAHRSTGELLSGPDRAGQWGGWVLQPEAALAAVLTAPVAQGLEEAFPLETLPTDFQDPRSSCRATPAPSQPLELTVSALPTLTACSIISGGISGSI